MVSIGASDCSKMVCEVDVVLARSLSAARGR